jgi:PPK2 family polyphosphate:nucleotide phosphotransferase
MTGVKMDPKQSSKFITPNVEKQWINGQDFLQAVHDLSGFNLASLNTDLNLKNQNDEKILENIKFLLNRISDLLGRIQSQKHPALLIIFQGMDASGKDGAIDNLLMHIKHQSLRTAHFIKPTKDESSHDFLWRIHKQVPSSGEIVIFNRSHYEEALIQKVHLRLPFFAFNKILKHIVNFENLITDHGTLIIKFFLNISKKTQYERFKSRLDDPGRRWKLTEQDLKDRNRWDQFIETYDNVMVATSTQRAPWFVIPADDKLMRDFYIAHLLLQALTSTD